MSPSERWLSALNSQLLWSWRLGQTLWSTGSSLRSGVWWETSSTILCGWTPCRPQPASQPACQPASLSIRLSVCSATSDEPGSTFRTARASIKLAGCILMTYRRHGFRCRGVLTATQYVSAPKSEATPLRRNLRSHSIAEDDVPKTV